MPNPVNWFEIYVDDVDRAKTFYSKVLGVEFTELPSPDEGEMWAFPMEENAPNAGGTLIRHPAGKPGIGGTLVYFACDDVADPVGRVADAGGSVMQDKMGIGDYGFIALIRDTEGNLVGLHSHK